MKNKIKLLSIAFALVMLGSFYVNAQNHFWTLPNQSINLSEETPPLPLPSAPPGYGYDNETSDFAHNAIASVTGEIEFFIVDGVIYDRDGYLISEMWVNEGAPGGAPFAVKGNSEVCVVPDPGSCWRYYIFSNRVHGQYPVGAYTILDMELQNTVPGNEDRLGALVFGEWEDGNNCEYILNLDLPDGAGGTILPSDNQNMFFAATDVNANNERFVFVQIKDGISKLIIDENGIYADTTDQIIMATIFPAYAGGSWGGERQELEVVELENGGYRLGFVYSGGDSQSSHVVTILELDENGHYIEDSAFIYPLESVGSNRPIVKGLEFSANGRYLYFTHHEVSSSQPAIQYIDYDMEQVFDLNVPNRTLFQYSQIETGVDGKLYFAYENGLAALDSADTPNTQFWIPNAITFTNPPSYAGFATQEEYKAYTLPDQIDGMDYSIYPFYPHIAVNVSAIDTWTPDDNPLSSDTSLVRIKEELRFTAGSNITIKNMRFEFYEGARVVIEPGARLTLDSTTFTIGPCFAKMWLGVEVWGTPSVSQYVSGNYHGQLVLENNSVIEHAYIGALAGSREDGTASNLFWYEKAGGIIRGFDSRFRNNMRDVLIQNHYSYNSYGDLISNVSRFNNCDFLTDGLLNHPEINPMAHATLYRVHNVRFDNCSFRNTASFQDLPIENRGIGIYTVQATFKANGNNDTYEPADDALAIDVNAHQSFYRLKVGVLSIGNENHFFTVNKMEFQLNHTGIYVFGSCYETITYNNFQVPEAGGNFPPSNPIDNIGVYLINSYLFTVEENTFFSSPVDTPNGGLVVDNSSIGDDPVENEVYRNVFYGLDFGIGVKRDNRDARSNRGLQARCNVFSDINVGDIILNPQSEWRDNQGEANPVQALTNNLFSHLGYECSYPFRELLVSDDYGSESIEDLSFDYFHLDDPFSTPDMDAWHSSCPQDRFVNVLPAAHEGVTLDYEEHCPSNFSAGGGIKWPLVELEVKLATAESNLVSAQNIYQATIDGGETEDIIDLLQNLFNEESAYLRDLLMARYPLSREALMAAIDAAESFDPWHLTQVLVANSRLPVDVYQFLKNNEVLAPFFMQFVDDAQTSGIAPLRSLLKSEISLRSYEKSQAERAINRHYLHHADSLDGTAWNNFVESRDEPYYQLYSIGKHNDHGETGAAQTLLDSLELTTDRTEWVQFMIDLAAADSVTANDIATGWDFFYNKPSTIGHAWGWLIAHGELDSLPSFEIEPKHRSFALASHKDPTKTERFLQAWPNPAKDRVMLTYPREAEGMGIVQVFNTDGRLMHEFTASDSGFQEINLTGWPNGLYIAKLIVNGKDFETVKISVVK